LKNILSPLSSLAKSWTGVGQNRCKKKKAQINADPAPTVRLLGAGLEPARRFQQGILSCRDLQMPQYVTILNSIRFRDLWHF